MRPAAPARARPTRTTRARRWQALPVLALLVLALVAPLPSRPAAAAVDANDLALAAYTSQPVRWNECYPGEGTPEFMCAILRVPEDWSQPRAGDIDLLISRIAATDRRQRRGALFLNFGGPGLPSFYAPLSIAQVEPAVAATYDLVGFDPRGAGSSTPLECADPRTLDRAFNLDALDPANTAEFPQLARRYGLECSRYPRTRFITTAQTVRDMDLIRAVLGERRISYLGVSAGTWLGAWYASTFPGRTDRFVLDANQDWTATWYENFSRQPEAFQRGLDRDLIPWLARYDVVYQLGATPARVRATLAARRAALQARPIQLEPGNVINGAVYDFGLGSALYGSWSFPDVAVALAALEHWPRATPDEQAAVARWFYGGSVGHSYDAFFAIICQDTPTPPPAVVLRNWLRDRDRFPLVGAGFADPCAWWTVPPTGSPVDGATLPPVLMIANDGDPATPYEGALRAHRAAPSSRLVTVRNEGGHGAYGGGLPCVEDVVNGYLVNGIWPRRDVVCPRGFPLPDPTATATAPSGRLRGLPVSSILVPTRR